MYLSNPMVSVIVPVYNAESTLRRCADSILEQSYPDLELILVDDGSPDESGALCDAWAAKDDRVTVIHQDDLGVSGARNSGLCRFVVSIDGSIQGIRNATGLYYKIVDSDDWLTPDATEKLVAAAEAHQADLVIADFYRVSGKLVASKHRVMPVGVMTRREYASKMMENPASFYYGVLWNKLYRRDLVVQHHLEMNPALRICEDFMFNLEYLRVARYIVAVPSPVYYYVRTKNSIVSQTYGMTTLKIRLAAFDEYKQFYMDVLDEKAYQKARLKVYRFLVDVAMDGVVLPKPAPGTRSLKAADSPETLDDDWDL